MATNPAPARELKLVSKPAAPPHRHHGRKRGDRIMWPHIEGWLRPRSGSRLSGFECKITRQVESNGFYLASFLGERYRN